MTSDRSTREDYNATEHREIAQRLRKLEEDFRFNILLLSERDNLIENSQSAIKKLCYMLTENVCVSRDQLESMLSDVMSQHHDIIPVNKATQCNELLLTQAPVASDVIDEDLSSQMKQYLKLSQSILIDTVGRNVQFQNKQEEFNVVTEELRDRNLKISQLKNANTDLSNHVSDFRSEFQGLSEDKKQLVEQVSSLQDDFSLQRSIFYSFYKSKERTFLDAKGRFIDIESKLISEVESLQQEIDTLKTESSQFENIYDEEHRNILSKNSKLTKLLIVLKEFILNERNAFSHQIAAKDRNIEQLKADIQILKATQTIKSDEIVALEKQLFEHQNKHKSLVQENRQMELDLIHSYEEREQVLTATHQSRLEHLKIEQQHYVSNLTESNIKITQLEETYSNLKSEMNKCIRLIDPITDSIDISEDLLQNKIVKLLDNNVNLKEVIEEMKRTIESLNNARRAADIKLQSPKPDILYLDKFYFNPDILNKDDTSDGLESLRSQLDTRTNEVRLLTETIEDLRTVLSQKDSLINSFNQHFSLLKSFAQPPSESKLSILSKETTQEAYITKIKIFAQRSISLMREKTRLVEANHKLKLENINLRERSTDLASKLPSPESEGQIPTHPELHNPYPYTASNIQEMQLGSRDGMLSSTPLVPTNYTESPNRQNSTLLSFNINNHCPDWFNDTTFQQALLYADNPELIDHEYPLSKS